MSIHGRGVDPHGSLSGVLRAATAPAHPEELAGEHAAVAAFRDARPAPRRSLLARILTVKAVIVAAAAVSTGVVVATTGGMPWHTETRPPAESPVVPDPASVPAVTVPAEPPSSSSTSSTQNPPGPSTRSSSTGAPGGMGGAPDSQHDREKDNPGPGAGKGDKDKDRDNNRVATSEPDEPTEQPNPQQTPDSSARGAVTAVPPSGAESPSPGG